MPPPRWSRLPRRFDFGSKRRRVAPCHACWSLSAGWLEYAPGPAAQIDQNAQWRTILPPARAGRVRGLFSTYLFFVRSCLFFGPFCVFRGQSRIPRASIRLGDTDPAKNCQTIPLWRACHAQNAIHGCAAYGSAVPRITAGTLPTRPTIEPLLDETPGRLCLRRPNIGKYGSHRGRCCRAARDRLVFLHLPLNPPGTTS